MPRGRDTRWVAIALLLIIVLPHSASRLLSAESRRWTGPNHFAIPLHDWSQTDGRLVAEPANFGGQWRHGIARLYKSTATVGDRGTFTTSLTIHLVRPPSKGRTMAGLWLGLKSRIASPTNVWIHPPADPLFVGVDSEGVLVAGTARSDAPLDPSEPIAVEVVGQVGDRSSLLRVTATPKQGEPVRLETELPASALSGAVCLVAQGAQSRWDFGSWTLEGDALDHRPEHSMGPILWTQYSLQDDGTLKLQAQMVPLEAADPQTATLEFYRHGRWSPVAEATLEILSSTFLFRVSGVDADAPVQYRVVYPLTKRRAEWTGTIRANPKCDREFTLAAFSCDHGEIFPQSTMVANVATQDPDMLFFAGDQIYENMDNVRIVREPLEGARLSYLSKWYQFGLTWRHLLKDRPSVIIPDDHDVFMGNIWGDAGHGYVMDPRWVNMIQRTQTGSLPDPIDPAPVARGIEVYFTALDYAGMSFAVVEDRKFKSQPKNFTFDRPITDPDAVDVEGATLLGQRQLRFLRRWTQRTADLPARFFLSQTLLAKGNTHAGSMLRRSRIDLDSNGWPQSARDRALRAIGRDTIMVHGDQHLGLLARMGIDAWDDGPLAFMVTGTSVGFPRAWWPERDPEGGPLDGQPYTGRYVDDLGNLLTVYGVTNPDPLPDGVENARARPDVQPRGVFAVQAAKGSGYGLIVVDKQAETARFEAYRLDFDAKRPTPGDQFDGFPITRPLR